MAWRNITIEEAKTLPFEYDESLIEQGIKDSIPAAEAAGVFGPERQKKRLASGIGYTVIYENGSPIYSSASQDRLPSIIKSCGYVPDNSSSKIKK